jgi:hypothetical protein
MGTMPRMSQEEEGRIEVTGSVRPVRMVKLGIGLQGGTCPIPDGSTADIVPILRRRLRQGVLSFLSLYLRILKCDMCPA